MKFPLNHSRALGGAVRLARTRQSARIMGALVLSLTLAGLTACSAIKVAYNQAPELAYWLLDDYSDFNGSQSLQVKAELARLQDWHRRTQLPLYGQSLHTLQQQLLVDITPEQACSVLQDARAKMAAVLAHAAPAVASVAATLQPAQLGTLERKFAKGNAQWRSEQLDALPREVQTRRFKQARERSELLYGKLSGDQLDALKRALALPGFDAAITYAERLRRQQDTLNTLQAVATAAPAVKQPIPALQAVQALMQRTLDSPNADYQRYLALQTRAGCAAFAELHQLASPVQRRLAVQHLNEYEQLVAGLAGAAP